MSEDDRLERIRTALPVHKECAVRRIANALRRHEGTIDGKTWADMSDRDMSALADTLRGKFAKASVVISWIRAGLDATFQDAADRWPTFMKKGNDNEHHTSSSSIKRRKKELPSSEYKEALDRLRLVTPCAYDMVCTVASIGKRVASSWDSVTNDEMKMSVLDALAARYSDTRYRSSYRALRTVLGCMYPDCERRWPILYSSYRLKRPFRMLERSPLKKNASTHVTLRLVEKQLATMDGGRAGAREVLDAINSGTISVHVPDEFYAAENAVIPAHVRAFVLLRWSDRTDSVAVFRTMARYADALDAISRNYQLGLVTVAYHMFTAVCPGGALVPTLEALTRAQLVERLRTSMPHYRAHVTCVLANFAARGPFGSLFPNIAAFAALTNKEIGYKKCPRGRTRDSLTLDEVKAIMAVAERDPRDHAMFCFYMHTGCRSRAGTLLEVRDVWDEDCEQARPRGRVVEKRGKVRTFDIDPKMAAAFSAHVKASRPTVRMFTTKERREQLTTDNVAHWFKALARSAGVSGDHVHMHALRRTFVTLLLNDGNKIEDISRTIDHESVAMTQYYVDRSTVSDKMSIPWLRGHEDARQMAMPTTDNLPPAAGSAATPRSQSSGSEVTIQTLLAANRMMIEKVSEMARVFNFIHSDLLTPVQRDQLTAFRQSRQEKGENESECGGLCSDDSLTSDA